MVALNWAPQVMMSVPLGLSNQPSNSNGHIELHFQGVFNIISRIGLYYDLPLATILMHTHARIYMLVL